VRLDKPPPRLADRAEQLAAQLYKDYQAACVESGWANQRPVLPWEHLPQWQRLLWARFAEKVEGLFR
jgi:hypothetical protein